MREISGQRLCVMLEPIVSKVGLFRTVHVGYRPRRYSEDDPYRPVPLDELVVRIPYLILTVTAKELPAAGEALISHQAV